jgi:ABC-type cobalamin/Fe3+-siderophores transport system ATPase subunit
MVPVEFKKVSFAYDSTPVLSQLTVAIPPGVTALAGPNGIGKSTFLLLASGRLSAQTGTVLLEGRDTSSLDEQERGRLCSLVFQNMEFETSEPLGELLEFVFTNGFLDASDRAFLKTVMSTFELENLTGRPTHALSKGEMQRAVMAFAVLYGSRVLAMDEPVFALEEHQKRRALGFLRDHIHLTGISLLYCAHELDLNRSFSDQVLLFSKGNQPRLGPADLLLSRESLEAAYQIPYPLLYQKEELHRSFLRERPTQGELFEGQV